MAAAAAQQPVSAQVVGNAFVQQYYHILHHSPGLVCRFYQDISRLGRPENDGSMSITTTMQAINDKILSLNFGEFRAEIKSVDAQESYNGGVHVLVTGYLIGKDNLIRNFAQSFFLAPQDTGYFVLTDIFRYVDNINPNDGNQGSANYVEDPVTPEQNACPVEENHVAEQAAALTDEANGGEVYNPPENGEVSPMEEEVPVAEVVDEVQDDSQVVVECSTKIEEVPKKSYASIVMDLKESNVAFSFPALALGKSPPKGQVQQVNPAPLASAAETPVSSSDAIYSGNDGEADGYSIYTRGLPMNATPFLLENEFKRFGPIKSNGIQVRNNRQGFCFGFVEFEVESAVQKAIEASPIAIGGLQAVVEEKRSTSRGNGRGRFLSGRGFGFRNEGARGRGNYGGGRGYGRGDFTSRNDFGNRSSNPNRGGDGYQRADNVGRNGGRTNRAGGGSVNGTAKNMAPRVSATA
ncbi:unnamed protein product [Ilex paraguariensis]|uniref:G3BP-like protein n=1 Tax=Ilex paraguariensis TaxID=185542 RepID=A0ABC8ULV9_9AQUA